MSSWLKSNRRRFDIKSPNITIDIKPVITQPEIIKPVITQPEIIKPVITPEIVKPVITPEIVKPVITPEIVKPVITPEIVKPVITPEIVKPVIIKPEIVKPVIIKPENKNKTNELIDINSEKVLFPIIEPLNVYIISNIQGGGTFKHTNDIINTFNTRYINFIHITNNLDLENKINTKNSIIFIQNLASTKIHSSLIVSKAKRFNCKIIIIIHDFTILSDSLESAHSAYLSNISVNKLTQALLNVSEVIIPSMFVLNEIKKVYDIPNYKIVGHIDKLSTISEIPTIPNINNNTINVCVPTYLSKCKGDIYYEYICNNINMHMFNEAMYKIQYILFINTRSPYYEKFKHLKNVTILNEYDEDELYELLKKYNIHLLLLLNKWGESYSYCLSKCLNSGIPILYSNIGSYIERIPKVSYYFPIEPNSSTNEIDTKMIIPSLIESFDYIIKNHNSIDTTKVVYDYVPNYYYDVFNEHIIEYHNNLYKENKEKYNEIFKIVQPYAIYFPQFHEIKENNINFYKGFSDMINLKNIKKINNDLQTPLNGLFGYYNLNYNKNIIDTEILLAKSYGFKGFGLYYYWFFINTITNEHKIFSDVIDYFFRDEFEDFDVFFIYCNEAWSNNPAFNTKNNSNKIYNNYSEQNICKFVDDLLPYFKHKNYRKIDNKPVFTLHQPWELSSDQINIMFTYLNLKCIEADFNGIHFIVNGIDSKEYNYNKYYSHPVYKDPDVNFMSFDNHPIINYDKCVNSFINTKQNEKESVIRSCFINFNNSVRLYHNAKYNTIYTSTKNNSDDLFRKFVNTQISYYVKKFVNTQLSHTKNNSEVSDISKIMLFNAWNEWGEQMTIMPSNELGFLYLNIIQDELLRLVN